MTIYVTIYREFRREYFSMEEEYQDLLREALAKLKTVYRGLKDIDRVIIIPVEGYDCLAVVYDELTPKEIHSTVIPFSYEEKKVYPEQDIEMPYRFIRD